MHKYFIFIHIYYLFLIKCGRPWPLYKFYKIGLSVVHVLLTVIIILFKDCLNPESRLWLVLQIINTHFYLFNYLNQMDELIIDEELILYNDEISKPKIRIQSRSRSPIRDQSEWWKSSKNKPIKTYHSRDKNNDIFLPPGIGCKGEILADCNCVRCKHPISLETKRAYLARWREDRQPLPRNWTPMPRTTGKTTTVRAIRNSLPSERLLSIMEKERNFGPKSVNTSKLFNDNRPSSPLPLGDVLPLTVIDVSDESDGEEEPEKSITPTVALFDFPPFVESVLFEPLIKMLTSIATKRLSRSNLNVILSEWLRTNSAANSFLKHLPEIPIKLNCNNEITKQLELILNIHRMKLVNSGLSEKSIIHKPILIGSNEAMTLKKQMLGLYFMPKSKICPIFNTLYPLNGVILMMDKKSDCLRSMSWLQTLAILKSRLVIMTKELKENVDIGQIIIYSDMEDAMNKLSNL
jgi:hypothetical protein